MRGRGMIIGLACAFGGAQCTPSQAPPETAPATQTVLPAGTIVPMRTARTLTSKDIKPGDLVELEVKGDLKAGDLLVIARHTRATATVVEAHPARRALRGGGHLGLELKTVNTITGDVIPLRATKTVRGERYSTHTDEVLGELPIILPWLPFLFKGSEASLPKGTAIDAYVDRDIVLDPAPLRDRMVALEAQEAAARMAARTGEATAHLYHDPKASLTQEILLDGHRLVRLRRGRFFTLRLPPATHTIRCQKSELSLDLKPDEEYYIRFVWESTFLSWRCEPTLVPSEQGEEQIYALAAADPKDVFPQPR
jgi:hypothetical protein